jgi:hypothetical protein
MKKNLRLFTCAALFAVPFLMTTPLHAFEEGEGGDSGKGFRGDPQLRQEFEALRDKVKADREQLRADHEKLQALRQRAMAARGEHQEERREHRKELSQNDRPHRGDMPANH